MSESSSDASSCLNKDQKTAQIDENGVDLTVLEYYLAMTPTERFESYERQIRIIFQIWLENNIEHDFECEYA